MKLYVIVLLTVALNWACTGQNQDKERAQDNSKSQTGQPSKDSVANLEQQVMAVHDSVMPKLSDVMRLKKAVSAKVAKVSEPAAKEQGAAINRQLDEADKAMMSWMYQYNGDTLGKLDQAKAVEYLKDQQVKVNLVRDQMQKSIAEAEKYL